MNLIDIYPMYRKAQTQRPINQFLESAPFSRAYEYLKGQDPSAEYVLRTKSAPTIPATLKVHPLLAMEFLRWLDYDRYAKTVLSHLTPQQQQQQQQ